MMNCMRLLLLISVLAIMLLPTAAQEAEKNLKIVATPNGWTISAINVDASELLTSLAAEAHMQMIVDDTVRRQITIRIIDRSSLDILKIIANVYGFSTAEINGVQLISEGTPRSPASYLLSDITSISTRYVTPSSARALLPSFLQSQVAVNSNLNSLVLSGPKSILDKVRQDVEMFDQPTKQVMLDVNVVEFTDMDTDKFTSMLSNSNASIGLTTDSLTGQLTLSALTELPTDFNIQLNALVNNRKARVRANPRIATITGQYANIFIGQQQYLIGSSPISAGVSLSVTPFTGGDGDIILDMSEEISTLSAPEGNSNVPTKTQRTAKSNIRVRDGQTIIIGGLSQDEVRTVRRSIPILGDIPLLGNFFRSKTTEHTKVDLAIFITARILTPTGHLPGENLQDLLPANVKLKMGIAQ